jgi:integrase
MSDLTQRKVERITAAGKHRDGLVRGLYLAVSDAGAKSWLLRHELHGRERAMGLGSASEFDLRAARERALAARKLLADGIDPLDRKQADRAAAQAAAARRLTFARAAESYSAQHEAKWTNASHRHQFLGTLRKHVFPALGSFDVAAITTADVIRTLEKIWNEKTVTADRVRSRIENVLDWCVIRGHRPPGTNPAAWDGHLSEVLPAPRKVAPIKHHPALPFIEVPRLIAELKGRDGKRDGIGPSALTFLIFTAARTNEVIGAKWDEVDFDAAIWTIPAARMKGRIEHQVPLAPEVIELLHALPREQNNPHLFIGAKPGAGISDLPMGRLINLIRPGYTVHGLRSSFRDWCGEQTNFPRDIAEMALSHKVGNAVEQAYRRGTALTKRRALMAAWARFCTTPAVATGAVVPIRGAR